MRRRIYRSLCLVAFFALILSTVVSLSNFYRFYYKQDQQSLATQCKLLSAGVQTAEEPVEWLRQQASLEETVRITFFREDGQVLYDSWANETDMENHKNRPEFQQALATGFGEDSRLSSTLGESTYYCAVSIPQKGQVLRLSRNIQNILGAFLQLLPFELIVTLFLFLLSLFCAQKATKRIVAPLAAAADNLGKLPVQGNYEELEPFLNKIRSQNLTILQQHSFHSGRKRTDDHHFCQHAGGNGALRSSRRNSDRQR